MLRLARKNSEIICFVIGCFILSLGILYIFSGCAKKEIVKEEIIKEEKKEISKKNPVFVEEPVKVKELKPKLEFKNVYFEFDKINLTPESKKILKQNSMTLKYYPEKTIGIEGHTDEIGKTTYNLLLGYSRAKMVCAYYIILGIAKNKITFRSYGEGLPADENHTREAHMKNRRAVTKIYE